MPSLKLGILLRDKKYIKITFSLFIIAFCFLLTILSKRVHFIDDAWITFRVSDNLAKHGELVFNLGERVEGTTNTLWAILLGMFSYTFSTEVEISAAYISIVMTGYILYRIWRICLLLEIDALTATIPSIILILTPDFYGTMTNGLEAPLFSLLLVDSLYLYIINKRILSFFFLGLLFTTRPEAILYGGALFLVILLGLPKKEELTTAIKGVIIYLSIVVFFTLLRIWYYGDVIPNSVRAKLIPIKSWIILEGLNYSVGFIVSNTHLVIVFIFLLILTWRNLTNKHSLNKPTSILPLSQINQTLLFCVTVVIFSFIVSTRNGGDWMPYYRLLSQYSLIYSILIIIAIKKKILNLLILISLTIIPFTRTVNLLLYKIQQGQNMNIVDYDADTIFWQEAVTKLSPNLSSTDIVSAEAIGYIGYNLADIYIHDPLGLTNEYIAMNGQPAVPYGKIDLEYTIYTVRPSVLIWHYAGNLENTDHKYLDENYITYCYSNCYDWSANIIMIREDRDNTLSVSLKNWKIIDLSSLKPIP